MRDYDKEGREQPHKKYNYDFDGIVRDYMMRDFERHFAAGPALEIGCYHGDSTIQLTERFADLTVIEASAEALEIARGRVPGRVKFNCSTIEQMDFASTFSSIFMINTLEHLEDAGAALAKARSWLSETGKLFVLVPNADAASRQIAVHMGLVESNDSVTQAEWQHGHRRTYSFDTLERDLRQNGLQSIARGGIIFKALANFQFDRALQAGIIDDAYVAGCHRLGQIYPNLCASIYSISQRVPGLRP
jgi:2-polyprenyl-3-methyl-5-hydroxy-6-metoxy-1,4-benzoquinol methylase